MVQAIFEKLYEVGLYETFLTFWWWKQSLNSTLVHTVAICLHDTSTTTEL